MINREQLSRQLLPMVEDILQPRLLLPWEVMGHLLLELEVHMGRLLHLGEGLMPMGVEVVGEVTEEVVVVMGDMEEEVVGEVMEATEEEEVMEATVEVVMEADKEVVEVMEVAGA